MRRLVLHGAGLLLMSTLVHAQEKLTLQTLSQWTATGSVPLVDAAQGTVTVLPGAQLSRTITAEQVSVRLVTRPYFSPVPADGPTLEIGPAGLTFVRDQSGGGLVMLGDQPLKLPKIIALGADGRSESPLDLTFRYEQQPGTATFLLAGEAFLLKATSTGGPLEVAVASGSGQAWVLDSVEVQTAPSVAASPPGSAPSTGKSDTSSPPVPVAARPVVTDRAATRKLAEAEARALFVSGSDVAAEKKLTDASLNPKNTPEWHLEAANELLQMAFSLARLGKPGRAAQIARLALQHTGQVAGKGAPPALAAAADETAAFIQEKLLADYTAAKTAYQSAAQRNPQGGAAKEVDRLNKIEQEGVRKATAPRG